MSGGFYFSFTVSVTPPDAATKWSGLAAVSFTSKRVPTASGGLFSLCIVITEKRKKKLSELEATMMFINMNLHISTGNPAHEGGIPLMRVLFTLHHDYRKKNQNCIKRQ